jgi:HEAT repeat protein
VILAMIKRMSDWNREVRASAIRWFESSPRDPRSVEPLIGALSAFFGSDRYTAILALGHQQDHRAVPPLLKILQNKNQDVGDRRSAAEALGKIGDPSVFPILVEILHDQYEPTPVRSGAVLGIGFFRGKLPALSGMPKTDAELFEFLTYIMDAKNKPLEVRASAAEVLGNFGNLEALVLLDQISAEHPRNILGFSAAESAVKLTDGAINDISFVNAIINYKIDPEEEGLYIPKKHDLLQKITEHGTAWRVRFAAKHGNTLLIDVPLGIIAIAFVVGIAVTLRWWWRRKKNSSSLGSHTMPDGK